MNEEGNRIQELLFKNDGERRYVYADITDKQRNTRKNAVIHVIAVPHHHRVLAVVLNEQDDRGGDKEVLLRLLLFSPEKIVRPDRKRDENGDHEEMPQCKISEPPKARTAELRNIEKVLEDIQRHTRDNRKGQIDKALRFYLIPFSSVPQKQEHARGKVQRVRNKE